MRILILVCLPFLVAIPSCDNGSTGSGIGAFDHLLFLRIGGGDKSFTVQPMSTLGLVEISVSRYQFRDTLVQFRCGSDPGSKDAFIALNDVLAGRAVITGDFRETSLATGTWARLYMVRNDERFEITNTELRNRLLGFENLVQAHFPMIR